MIRTAAALAATAAIVVGATGCQTTQEQSAKIGRRLGHQSAIAGTTVLGAVNRDVRVTRSVLLSTGGQSAVALELTNTSAVAQADFPVLVDVLDAKGRSIYRNDTKGIQASIQQLALLAPHASAWWVDNEVLASGTPSRVTASVGAAAASAPATLPAIGTRSVSASDSFPGPHVSVTIVNRSPIAQRQLAVYAVALRGATVVGAGRGIVAALAPGASSQVLIPMIGQVSGSSISVTAPATGLR